jgi:hypothetical protein
MTSVPYPVNALDGCAGRRRDFNTVSDASRRHPVGLAKPAHDPAVHRPLERAAKRAERDEHRLDCRPVAEACHRRFELLLRHLKLAL